MTFRDWYTSRYGAWAGQRAGEPIVITMANLCDAVADYVDGALEIEPAEAGLNPSNGVAVIKDAEQIYKFIVGATQDNG